jgi:MYXO-CTERM domain-containing protein
LPDIAPPHFGHLMEEEEATVDVEPLDPCVITPCEEDECSVDADCANGEICGSDGNCAPAPEPPAVQAPPAVTPAGGCDCRAGSVSSPQSITSLQGAAAWLCLLLFGARRVRRPCQRSAANKRSSG